MHWNLDTPGALLAVISIFGLLLSGLIWIIDARISRIRREMVPDGGTSMRDVLDRIEAYVLARIPECIGVDIEDDSQLDDADPEAPSAYGEEK